MSDVSLPDPDTAWTTTITARRGWLDWRLGELWRYRDLITIFVWRDFTAAYKQTILGPAWHILQPVLTTLTFTLVFGAVARLPTGGVPPFLFYLAGTVLWTYFSNTLTATSSTFLANAALLSKVYFHRLAIPISIVISNLVALCIQLSIFLIVLGWYLATGSNVRLTAWVWTTPLLVFMLAGYALGGGIVISALTTRYRDLNKLISFGVQLMMFGTPVVYPVSMVPERLMWFARLNPLTPIMEAFRLGFVGSGTVTFEALGISFLGMVLLLTAGVLLFTHVERTFMDTV